MSDCLFCKIAAGEIPAQKVYEDELVLAFRDIQPQAPVHILVIPKRHVESAACITPDNSAQVARCFEVIAELGKALPDGFRVVSNCGPHAGQTVPHLHFHLLGGGPLALEMA